MPGAWWENTGSPRARELAAERGGYGSQFDLAVYFLHDVPPEVAAAGEPHQRSEADAVSGSVCDFKDWPSVPIRVVAGAVDRFFPVEFQRVLVGLGRVVGAVGRSHESLVPSWLSPTAAAARRAPVATAEVAKMTHDTRRLPLSLARDGRECQAWYTPATLRASHHGRTVCARFTPKRDA